MKIKKLLRLPWILRDAIRAMRRDLADCRQTIAELLQMIAARNRRHEEVIEQLLHETRRNEALALEHDITRRRELALLGEMLVGEIREQALLTETAVRSRSRAGAETKLRLALTPPESRAPGVSILIACWNHAGCIGRAIASAVATLESLPVPGEVLIVDDASRDASRAVAHELVQSDQRVRLITSDANLGLPRARNLLLSQARFQHAMILDSDNVLVPDGVAALYATARETGAVLAYGNIVEVDTAGAVLGVVSNERVSADLLKENSIDAMVLVRTERLLELGGYDCEWLYGLEDWELNQRLFTLGEPMVFVPALVGKYTRSSLSMLHEAHLAARYRRSARIFGWPDVARTSQFRACVHHPAIGTLWASAGWRQASPTALRRSEGPPSSRLNILVVSSGGVLNFGDDAILLSTLQRLARIRPDCLATVVSDGPLCPPLGRLGAWAGTCEEFCAGLDPADIRRGCGDDPTLINEFSRYNTSTPQFRTELKSFDVVLMAGGGNLNLHWPELIARRAAVAAACRSAGVPYILSGQGVGPVSAEIMPTLKFLVDGATAVATRDELSLRMLKEIAPNGPRMKMVGDDALGLRSDPPLIARRYLAEIGVPLDRPLVAFQARLAPYVGFSRAELEETARHVDAFAAENGYAVVSVPINMQAHGPEVALLAELAHGRGRRAAWHIVNHAGDVAAIAGVTKVCSAVLTHSYHAAIFALEERIPTLLFARTEYYQLKAEALRTAFGLPVSLMAPADPTPDAIAEQLENIARCRWSPGMTSADVDAWLNRVLPRSETGVGTFLSPVNRDAWGIAG